MHKRSLLNVLVKGLNVIANNVGYMQDALDDLNAKEGIVQTKEHYLHELNKMQESFKSKINHDLKELKDKYNLVYTDKKIELIPFESRELDKYALYSLYCTVDDLITLYEDNSLYGKIDGFYNFHCYMLFLQEALSYMQEVGKINKIDLKTKEELYKSIMLHYKIKEQNLNTDVNFSVDDLKGLFLSYEGDSLKQSLTYLKLKLLKLEDEFRIIKAIDSINLCQDELEHVLALTLDTETKSRVVDELLDIFKLKKENFYIK